MCVWGGGGGGGGIPPDFVNVLISSIVTHFDCILDFEVVLVFLNLHLSCAFYLKDIYFL